MFRLVWIQHPAKMDVLFVLISSSVCVFALLFSFLWPKRRLWLVARKLPGPQAWPIIGNLLQLQGDGQHTFELLVNTIRTYGSVFRMWLGPKLFIVISDPADIQIILGSSKSRNRDYLVTKAMVPFLGNGLLTARDDQWKTHRKFITPTFHFNVLQTYVEIFGSKSEVLCQKLSDLPDGSVVNIHNYLGMCTMDAICETAIGMKMNIQHDGGSPFYQGIIRASELIHNRIVHPWFLSRCIYPFTADGKEAVSLKKSIFGFTDKVVAKKLAEYRMKNSHPPSSGQEDPEGRKKITTLLEMLIESSESEGSVMSVPEIRNELTTIAAAGFDTVATTISNLCLFIGLHPLVQDKIFQELDSIFEGDLRPATLDDINRMEYIARVLKETLRLLPVAPMLVREITEDIILSTGQLVPAGCSTATFNYMVHRDPRYFPDPESFLPDRWLPDDTTPRHPYSYLPFSAGMRNCLGQKYAILQLKSIISSLLRRFKVSHQHSFDDLQCMQVSVSMRFSKEYTVTLTKR